MEGIFKKADMGKVTNVIEDHKSSGRFIMVDQVNTFVLDKGEGEVVFCIHGVPTSSYLYRKVIAEIAEKGCRGICIDLPGLGLTDRPANFDYSFLNFARFCRSAANKLGIDKFHLVVHDIGGPIGFALAAENPERILSITILNTWIDVVNFEKPLPMKPFEKPVLGEAELALVNHITWRVMFKSLGVEDDSKIPAEEIDAYVDLLKREDGGKAFLKIMRNFDHSVEFKERCYRAVQNVPYPIQAIWGVQDPGLTFDRYGKEVQNVTGLNEIFTVTARHLLQEEQFRYIASRIEAVIHASSVLHRKR